MKKNFVKLFFSVSEGEGKYTTGVIVRRIYLCSTINKLTLFYQLQYIYIDLIKFIDFDLSAMWNGKFRHLLSYGLE